MVTSFGSPRMRFRIGVVVEEGRIRVDPERAEVPQGTLVEWDVLALPGLPSFEFEVYFSADSPFEWKRNKGVIKESRRQAARAVVAGAAQKPGDYKYGVRAVAGGGKVLADDDPYLVVLPG